jgi:hypothetical protein
VLSVEPPSGGAGIEITISGEDFEAGAAYVIYWAPPDLPIGDPVTADGNGRIAPFTYTVPISATVGEYQIIARFEGKTASAQTPFSVTE